MDPDKDLELRASDFRKAWPTAMVVALRECGDLADQISETNSSIQESKKGIFKLAEMIPQFLSAAEARLDDSVIKFIEQISGRDDQAASVIRSGQVELERQRKEFSEYCRVQNQKLMDTASRLQSETELLNREKLEFEKEKLTFSKLSVFERIVYKL